MRRMERPERAREEAREEPSTPDPIMQKSYDFNEAVYQSALRVSTAIRSIPMYCQRRSSSLHQLGSENALRPPRAARERFRSPAEAEVRLTAASAEGMRSCLA